MVPNIFTGPIDEELLYYMVESAGKASLHSDHHQFKVGATMASISGHQPPQIRTSANRIPLRLKSRGVDSYTLISGQHPTAHSEFMLMKDAPVADFSILACNICLCPSCGKLSTIFGIDAIAYNARTFSDPVYQKRFEEGWQRITLPIMKAAGIQVYKVDLEDRENGIEVVEPGMPHYKRPLLPPLLIEQSLTDKKYRSLRDKKMLRKLQERVGDKEAPAAIAQVTHRVTGQHYLLGAVQTRPVGFGKTAYTALSTEFNKHRYTLEICPTERIVMEAAKRNLTLEGGIMVFNFLPSTARQIDLMACGLKRIIIPKEAIVDAQDREEGMRTINDLYANEETLPFHLV